MDEHNVDTPLAKPKLKNLTPDKNKEMSSVGSLSVQDLMKLMSSLMDEKLTNMKQNVEEIKLNASGLSSKLDEVKTENECLRKEVIQLRDEKEKDHQQIMYLQEHIKRNNIIFQGIAYGKSLEDAVKTCCKENLKMSQEINLLSTRKLYENDGKMGVVAEFSSGEVVKEVFKNVKNLAGSKIIIERDLSIEKQQDRRVFLEIKKSFRELKGKHHILVRNEKMKIGDKWFWWNKNKNLVCGTDDVTKVLENLFGQAFKSVNINYNEILTKLNSKN